MERHIGDERGAHPGADGGPRALANLLCVVFPGCSIAREIVPLGRIADDFGGTGKPVKAIRLFDIACLGRQPFDRIKLRGGLERAAHKRPVHAEAIDELVNRIEAAAVRGGGEITAAKVGEMCLSGLRRIDQVAYLQFAAVYRQLDVTDVQAELDSLTPNLTPSP